MMISLVQKCCKARIRAVVSIFVLDFQKCRVVSLIPTFVSISYMYLGIVVHEDHKVTR